MDTLLPILSVGLRVQKKPMANLLITEQDCTFFLDSRAVASALVCKIVTRKTGQDLQPLTEIEFYTIVSGLRSEITKDDPKLQVAHPECASLIVLVHGLADSLELEPELMSFWNGLVEHVRREIKTAPGMTLQERDERIRVLLAEINGLLQPPN